MKTIHLKKLILENFKGLKHTEITFNTDITKIIADNGKGKTTVLDGYIWLLFGKNANGEKDFNIKTLDQNNEPIHRLEHFVLGVFDIDGIETTIKRVYKEKWTKKRGEEVEKLTGHTSEYYYNNVPMNEKHFSEKVNDIIEETVFKLLSNPMYFNSLKWKDRREMLMKLAGEITTRDIIEGDQKMIDLVDKVDNENKTIQGYEDELKQLLKKTKEALAGITPRISEQQMTMPENRDWNSLLEKQKSIIDSINKIDEQIADKLKLSESILEQKQLKQKEIYKLKETLQNIEFEQKKASNEKKNTLEQRKQVILNEIEKINNNVAEAERKINENKSKIETLNKELDLLKENEKSLFAEFKEIENMNFLVSENETICQFCGQPLPKDKADAKIEDLKKSFMQDKARKMQDLNEKIKRNKSEQQAKTQEIEYCKKQLIVLSSEKNNNNLAPKQAELSSINKELAEISSQLNFDSPNEQQSKEIEDIKAKIRALEEDLAKDNTIDTTELKQQKIQLESQRKEVDKILAEKDLREKALRRIEELTNEGREYASLIAQYERDLFLIEKMEFRKMDILEQRISDKFLLVSFKMYKKNLNGGIEPTCKTLVDGVPYSDLNTASRINAGIDIINVFANHFNIFAPVFIDNAESVSNILPIKSQMVILEKVKGVDRLEVVLQNT